MSESICRMQDSDGNYSFLALVDCMEFMVYPVRNGKWQVEQINGNLMFWINPFGKHLTDDWILSAIAKQARSHES